MKFSSSLFIAIASVAASPLSKRGVDPNLVPQFGVTAGQQPDGTGNCIGINNIKIPCSCPPDRNTFISKLSADVAAGHATNNPSVAVSFPTDNSASSQAARIEASIIALQNLNGPGVGCPASSTTFSAQLAAAQAAASKGAPAPAAAPAAPAPAPAAALPAAAAAPASGGVDPNLVPQFGVTAGQSPDGTGNCIGINNIKIPCSCPPDRNTFIQKLSADVAAGHATNNPSVSVSFPTDNSPQSLVTRIEASIIALQNLNGPGVGCPASSTTFSAQLAAAQAAARR